MYNSFLISSVFLFSIWFNKKRGDMSYSLDLTVNNNTYPILFKEVSKIDPRSNDFEFSGKFYSVSRAFVIRHEIEDLVHATLRFFYLQALGGIKRPVEFEPFITRFMIITKEKFPQVVIQKTISASNVLQSNNQSTEVSRVVNNEFLEKETHENKAFAYPVKVEAVNEKEVAVKEKEVKELKNFNATIIAKSGKNYKKIMEENRKFAQMQVDSKKTGKVFKLEEGEVDPFFKRKLFNCSPELLKCSPGIAETHYKSESWRAGVGVAAFTGHRDTMEDADLATKIYLKVGDEQIEVPLFGIFDGHGGANISCLIKERIGGSLARYLEKTDFSEGAIYEAIKQAFQDLDGDEVIQKYTCMGTTASVAFVLKDLWVANLGDSRIVLSTPEKTIQLTEDAIAENERYKKVIEKRGGKVINNRIVGEFFLEPARVFGDYILSKQALDKNEVRQKTKFASSTPKIASYPMKEIRMGVIVIGCDGLFDVATSNEVGVAVRSMMKKGVDEKNMAAYLVNSAFKADSRDNISVMVINGSTL